MTDRDTRYELQSEAPLVPRVPRPEEPTPPRPEPTRLLTRFDGLVRPIRGLTRSGAR